MATDLLETWRESFWQHVQRPAVADLLKAASLNEDLRTWTTELTTAVVKSSEAIGWSAAAKWNPCRRLPKHGQEYLAMDVMAFPAEVEQCPRWPLPLAAFELENARKDDRVAYSMWKLLCVQARLRVVFAYRPDWEQGRQMVGAVCQDVIGPLTPAERSAIHGQVVLIVGNRGEGETFPWGYFKFWVLNANLGRFEKA